jgi:sterol desaturase/sphingolipid hydroxylase (fatty acid hydroxylase superfamily)
MDSALISFGTQLNGLYYYVLAAALGVTFFLEGLRPAMSEPNERARWLHVARNVALWALGFLFVDLFVFHVLLENRSQIALPTWGIATLPPWLGVIAAVLILDFVAYASHRISHQFRPLWQLHLIHHSDLRLDGSTALRAHPGEVLFGGALNAAVLALCGIPIWMFAFRATPQIPIAILHHANWRLPPKLEAALEWIFVTPAMHLLHHSPLQHETNSNYGQTFSFWDRWFGTYRDPRSTEASKDSFGLERLRDPRWHSIAAMLKLPLSTRRFDRF